jgi:mono/diheme cytochrome c family protein
LFFQVVDDNVVRAMKSWNGSEVEVLPWFFLVCLLLFSALATAGQTGESGAFQFQRDIRPILVRHCYDCHGNGAKKGNLSLEKTDLPEALSGRALWLKVLENIRAGLMPPKEESRLSNEERQRLEEWIKYSSFGIDPKDPDPGHVIVRRLNRVEYRNTIHDLLGVDFDTDLEFPPDDTAYGFDNIGQVLTVSPILLEKYFTAARTIVSAAISTNSSGKGKFGTYFSEPISEKGSDRFSHAKEAIERFATRAFRRPPGEETVDRLARLAEGIYSQPGQTYEAGIGQAMVATLASPRFIFREEEIDPESSDDTHPFIDEYSLASRLSYFLWSSMPDEELLRLAQQKSLRRNLPEQLKRIAADGRSAAFIENFAGQWLRSRDILTVPIEATAVLARDRKPDPDADRARTRLLELSKLGANRSSAEEQELQKLRVVFLKRQNWRPTIQFNHEVREALQTELEKYFDYVVHADRSVTELIESDYTFLNENLARYYGLTNLNIGGSEFRRVILPAGCVRGGVLTMGSVLAVTSNPNRTSPVKRGLFVLQNILGIPTAPQPPNIPALEDSTKESKKPNPTVRQTLEIHRGKPQCSSCHDRMDPPGLAFENFNALGIWREEEHGQAIESKGVLITGESFKNIQEFKHLLAANHREEFYRALTEKVLTYALGRGLEYTDVEAVDRIVKRLGEENGRFSALLAGVVESVPFQRTRRPAASGKAGLSSNLLMRTERDGSKVGEVSQ